MQSVWWTETFPNMEPPREEEKYYKGVFGGEEKMKATITVLALSWSYVFVCRLLTYAWHCSRRGHSDNKAGKGLSSQGWTAMWQAVEKAL